MPKFAFVHCLLKNQHFATVPDSWKPSHGDGSIVLEAGVLQANMAWCKDILGHSLISCAGQKPWPSHAQLLFGSVYTVGCSWQIAFKCLIITLAEFSRC